MADLCIPPIYLFIYSLLYISEDSSIFYILGDNLLLLYFFCGSDCSSFGHREWFQWVPPGPFIGEYFFCFVHFFFFFCYSNYTYVTLFWNHPTVLDLFFPILSFLAFWFGKFLSPSLLILFKLCQLMSLSMALFISATVFLISSISSESFLEPFYQSASLLICSCMSFTFSVRALNILFTTI